jgi:hypothetical protein
MLKQLPCKLFILSVLVACLTLSVPSTSAQGSGYQLRGTVYYSIDGALPYSTVEIYKWDGSSWVFHGSADTDACGSYTYDTGGPGTFKAVVPFNLYNVAEYYCGYPTTCAYASGEYWDGVEVSTEQPVRYMDICTS